jgi:hypothetical protein
LPRILTYGSSTRHGQPATKPYRLQGIVTLTGSGGRGGPGQIWRMNKPPDPHYRHRFPAEVIIHAFWLYHVFSLSVRDVELLLSERGVFVSYESAPR